MNPPVRCHRYLNDELTACRCQSSTRQHLGRQLTPCECTRLISTATVALVRTILKQTTPSCHFCSLHFSKCGLNGYPSGSVTSAALETNLLAQLVQIFCRLIAIPVTQTTVSKHLRELRVPMRVTHSLRHLFLMQHWTLERRDTAQPPSRQRSLF